MDSLKNVSNKLGKWIEKNVTGQEKAKTMDYTPVDPKSKEIKDRYDRMEDKIENIEKDISKIADTSELRPPKLSDISDKELVIMGTAGGAAIGGALGMTEAVIESALDNPKIEVTETEHAIENPVLKGYDDRMIEDKDSGGMLKGYDHKFTPRIEYEKVGDYKVPEARVSHTVDAESPVMSGIKGMATGAIIGGVSGVGVAVGRKLLNKGKYVPRKDRNLEGEGKVIAGGAVVGAAGGAVVGGLGAMVESGHSAAEEISWKQPVMEEKTIGKIPQDHYHSVFETIREDNIPKRDVTVEGPRMKDGLLGEKPVMEKMETTVEIEPRFGFLSQVLGGAVLGAVGGALAGVVVNVLRKII